MGGGSRESGHVQQCAAANSDDVRMAVNVVAVNVGMDFGDVKIGVLGALAAFDDERGTDQFEAGRRGAEISLDLRAQPGLGLSEGFVHHYQDGMGTAGSAVGKNVVQERIGRGEDVLGEKHPEFKPDLDGSLNDRHSFYCGRIDAELRVFNYGIRAVPLRDLPRLLG